MKKLFSIILFFGFLPHLPFAQTSDHWYTITIAAKPAGYYHENVTSSDSTIRRQMEMNIRISRLGSETMLDSRQVVNEDSQGNLNSITSEILYSKQLNTSKAIILPGVIRITNWAGGQQSTRDLSYSGALTGIEGVRLLTIENLKYPGDSISYQLFLSEFGITCTAKRELTGFEDIKLNGTQFTAMRIKESFAGLPIRRNLWLKKNGQLLKSSEPGPFGETEIILSDKASAIAISMMKTQLSEDQYASTLARANVRLPQPRLMESVKLKITQKQEGLGMPDLGGSYQKVLAKKDNYVILEITKPRIGQTKEPLTASEKAEFLESGYFIDKNDTVAQRLAKEIIGKEEDPWRKVVLLRDWVNVHMKFNTGIVMAPSPEAIRNLEGTCISFATVLTTLCRAADIPARYVMGFVYIDGIWGGHAWVEVYLDNSWIPVDAAMASPGGIADAARFYFSRNSVTNGMGELMIAGAQLYSNVTIETLSYTVNGREWKAPPSLYEVNPVQYTNPGLGITMKSIKGFGFNSTDKVYPENLLFSLDNPSTQQSISLYVGFVSPRSSLKDEVRRHVSNNDIVEIITHHGMKAVQSETTTKTVLAIPNGNDIYVFVSSGPKATENLKKAMKGFTFQKF